MYLKLTTAFNPGNNDATGATYPHVYIPRMSDAPTGTNLSFDWEYGTASATTVTLPASGLLNISKQVSVTTWVKGPGAFTQHASISGNDYLTIVNSYPLVTLDTSYNSIIRQLYQYLITVGAAAGTITT